MNTKTTSVLQSGQRARQLAALMNELGLVRPPFPATPDWESYFLSPRLEERMDDLISSLAMRRGFVLVTGEVGVGKTTLTRLLVEHLRREGTSAALVINTVSSRGVDLLRTILIDFGLTARGETPGELLAVLNAYLLQQHSRDVNCVLIIDDAQALDVPSLELIRQISNLETATQKLIQVVLVGQPELLETLGQHDLRQLRSRIALHLKLEPMPAEEIDAYIHHRLLKAGNASAFSMTPGALALLARTTGGYARLVNLVMDRCVFALLSHRTRVVDEKLMRLAIIDAGVPVADNIRSRSARLRPVVIAGLAMAFAVALAATWVAVRPDQRGWGAVLAGWAGADVSSAEPETVAPGRVNTARSAGAAGKVASLAPAADASTRWQSFWTSHGLDSGPFQAFQSDPSGWLEHANRQLGAMGWRVWLLEERRRVCHGGLGLELPIGPQRTERTLVLYRVPVEQGASRPGRPSETVRWAQQRLRAAGMLESADVDAVMGPRTEEALQKFQRSRRLSRSGELDGDTLYELACVGSVGR